MKQELIRQKLNEFIADEGIRANFIAQKVNIHVSVFSRFRKNKLDLYPEQLDAIEIFLNSKQSANK